MHGSQYQLVCKETIDQRTQPYVIQIASPRESSIVAALLTDGCISLHNTETLRKVKVISDCTTTTDVHFSHTNHSLMWTSDGEGFVKAWDLRKSTDKPVMKFQDDTTGKPKPILNFDVSGSDSIICAGTELIDGEDAFLLFWDCRNPKLLGGYWESHTDDITQVKFHPSKPDIVSSASTDGLINIFDIREKCEDDALLSTMNTESSVDRIEWHLQSNNLDMLTSVTHTNDLKLWDAEGSSLCTFNQDDFASITKKSVDYVVMPAYNTSNQEIFIIAGTLGGDAHIFSIRNQELQVSSCLSGGHSDVIRCAAWIDQKLSLITGGEDGSLCCWKHSSDSDRPDKQQKDGPGKKRKRNWQHKKPY